MTPRTSPEKSGFFLAYSRQVGTSALASSELNAIQGYIEYTRCVIYGMTDTAIFLRY